jgi:hypothetical protein
MIALSILAAAAAGWAVSGSWGAAMVCGLSLSGAAFCAQLLLFGWTGPQSDLALIIVSGPFLLRSRSLPAPGEAPKWLLFCAGAAALFVTGLFVEHSRSFPDGGWDAIAIWNMRARALFAAPHDLHAVFGPAPLAHSDYPPLVPGLIAHGWFALGRRSVAVPIVIAGLYAAGGAGALWKAAAVQRGRAVGTCALLALICTPQFLIQAQIQYADLKLAMLLLVAVAFASERRHAAAGLAAGLAGLTKNEGLLEAFLLVVALALTAGPRVLLRFLAGASAPLALLVYFKLRVAPPSEIAAAFSLSQGLSLLKHRLGWLFRAFLRQAVDFPVWGLAPLAIAAAWAARLRRLRRSWSIAAPFVLLCLGLFFCIYLVTPFDLQWHVRQSLDRLLFQLFPSVLYATVFLWEPAAQPASEPAASAA